jgi:nucleoside-diphosphate-sugar epimerase
VSTRKRLLITGGCGVIGTILKDALKDKYEITCLDTRKTSVECVIGDITKLDEIAGFFEEKDAVIHLAAMASLDADWNSVYSMNILGTYNVFEASRRSKVRKIVFASSNHVTGLYEKDPIISSITKGKFSGINTSDIPMVSHLSPPRADTFYGASKLFGEGLGQYYSDEYNISVVCLRIGTVRPYSWPKPDETRFFATWLSHSDLIQLVERSLEAENLRYDVFYGVSKNKWRFWDIAHSKRIIGYAPQDDAEIYRP